MRDILALDTGLRDGVCVFVCVCVIFKVMPWDWISEYIRRKKWSNARYWMLGAGVLGRLRGRIWGGRREEGSGWGTQVYLWRIHFDIWQNEYNIVKFKNKIKEKKKRSKGKILKILMYNLRISNWIMCILGIHKIFKGIFRLGYFWGSHFPCPQHWYK